MRQPNQTISLQNKKYAQLGLAGIRIRCKRDSSLKARVRMWVSNWAHESGTTSVYIYIHKPLHVGLPDQSNDPHSCRYRKCSSRVSNITEICWSFNFANHWKAPFWKNAGTHSADIHNLHVRQTHVKCANAQVYFPGIFPPYLNSGDFKIYLFVFSSKNGWKSSGNRWTKWVSDNWRWSGVVWPTDSTVGTWCSKKVRTIERVFVWSRFI